MLHETEAAYRRALEWIHSIGRFGIKQGLQRIEALLSLLGDPHKQLKYIHIGGTNGKGSVAAMIAAVLQASGYRAALFTSPYVLSFTNRMSINGRDISCSELVELVEQVRPFAEELSEDERLGPLTEFEVVTALALTYFARKQPDLVVLEVGLGGRLDATNVITPLVSIITNIGLDHTEVLGKTVEAVAREKAGIIKTGTPVVTGTTDPRARQVIAETCRERLAPLFYALPSGESAPSGVNSAFGTRREIVAEGQLLDYDGFTRSYQNLYLPLRGDYQVGNTAVALAALEMLSECGFSFSEKDLRRGLAETVWPARLELLRREPLLIMDGAHNPAAMSSLAASLPKYFSYRCLILVLGVMADKDLSMLDFILPLADTVVLTKPDLPRAAAPEMLAAWLENRFTGNVIVQEKVDHALNVALALAGKDDAVLVTGSFYTVSEARAVYQDLIQHRTE
ncbi:MAG: folylpolyglutamate synthase/dihydrofolate synthase family protein [Dethiobacteria bacterium]|jgi:dihydrofolate synthase/folylpolyglutamate synthase|nr:folylpolyglutamate synthase/dihydrofolate synthase family protein [Bacillota bacterium]NMD33123.1 bifunctional folylpolyglutamate synthase/dihydrofolate synthase [Bacillota bacterium]